MLGPVDLPRLGWRQGRLGTFLAARLAKRYSAEVADDADESAAVRAWIAFGRALLITAGTAHHQIFFAQIFRHQIRGLKLMNADVILLTDRSLTAN
jgi:hypothetical protein